MRILILGGTRFMGPRVVARLARAGHELCVFHRGRSRTRLPDGCRELFGDRRQLEAHARELRAADPDCVLDMIAATEADALALVGVFSGHAARLVVVSSMDVYRPYGRMLGREVGPPDPVPLDEDGPLRESRYPYQGETPRASDDPARWLDDYDKILVEETVLAAADLEATVLRLPMVYGPDDYQHRLHPYLKRMDDDRPAILLDRARAAWKVSRGYVDNMAAAIALAVIDARASGRTYNVCEPHTPSEQEWVESIARAAGWPGRIEIVPASALPESLREEGTDHHLACDASRIRRELGYREVVDRHSALARTVAWERAHPPEQIDAAAFDYAAEDRVLAARER